MKQPRPQQAQKMAVTIVSISTCRADLKASPAQSKHHFLSMRLSQLLW